MMIVYMLVLLLNEHVFTNFCNPLLFPAALVSPHTGSGGFYKVCIVLFTDFVFTDFILIMFFLNGWIFIALN
jgi:hypothetical protein